MQGYFLCCCQDDGEIRWISTETKQIVRLIKPPQSNKTINPDASSLIKSPTSRNTLLPYDSFLESLKHSCFCVKWIESETFIHDSSLLPRSSHFFSHKLPEGEEKGPPEPETFSLFSTVDGEGTISISVEGNIHLATIKQSQYVPTFSIPDTLLVPISFTFTPDLSVMTLLHSAGAHLCLSVFDVRVIAANTPHLQLLHHHTARVLWLAQQIAATLHRFHTRWTDSGNAWMDTLHVLIDSTRCLLS